jgi:hypothetical protein
MAVVGTVVVGGCLLLSAWSVIAALRYAKRIDREIGLGGRVSVSAPTLEAMKSEPDSSLTESASFPGATWDERTSRNTEVVDLLALLTSQVASAMEEVSRQERAPETSATLWPVLSKAERAS